MGDFDTNTEDPFEILRLCDKLASCSVSDVVLTIYPSSVHRMRQQMGAVKKAMEIWQRGARIHGVHLEGPFLNPLRCGALNPSSFLKPSIESLKMLLEGYEDVVKIITISPELDGALEVIGKAREMGILVNMGHSDATFEQAEEAFRRGATGITHLFNAQRPFHHRQPGISGFALTNPQVYVEVIADGVHLHKATMDLIFSMKPEDRVILVSDCVSTRALGKGLAGGTLSLKCIADRLVKDGYRKDLVEKWVWHNPLAYLHSAAVQK